MRHPSPRRLVYALRCPEFPVEKFDEIRRIWEASAARRKALEDGASRSGKGGATATDVIVISDDEEGA
jgi:hypothetical protein